MSYERIIPIRGSEVSRRAHAASVTSGANAMQPGEYHSSTDAAGFTRHFISHRHVGGYLYHGDVADEAAMLALDRPAYGHGCFPGDTCRRTDLPGSPVMLCIGGYGTTAADWVQQSDQSALVAAVAAKADTTALAALETATNTALAAKADAADLTALEQSVDNLTLADSGDGVSLISEAPFGLRKLVAGAGVTLAIVGGAIEISAETGPGGNPVTGTASDAFSGIATGSISGVSTGWGWTGNGTSETVWLPHASDGFTGITIGTITEVTTGTGWTGAGTSEIP